MTNRTKLIETAKSFLGITETDGGHKQIIDIYNSISPVPRGYRLSYSDPWCAAFVSAAGERAGLKEILPECSCDAMIALYKARGLYRSSDYKPQMADLVFYDWDDSGSADHVGIVCETGSLLKVIEGNVSDSVDYRLIAATNPSIKGYAAVFDKSSGNIVGGGALDAPEAPFEPASGDTVGASIARPLTEVSIPVLSYGSAGNSVRSLQQLLIGRGHSCGTYGADGEFGAKTRDALIGFQKRSGLSPDAIAGKQTWTKLLL